MLHSDKQLAGARDRLLGMFRDLIADAAESGAVRNDLRPNELAGYCLHALEAARQASSDKTADRLVDLVLDGMRSRA